MANTLRQLERELGALFGGGPYRPRRRRAPEPTLPMPDRFVVHIGTDETPLAEAKELGRYPTWDKAIEAQRAYNEAHYEEDIYAYAPVAL